MRNCGNSIAAYTNRYCTKYPCTLCPCGKYEFPDCVRELAKLEESQQEADNGRKEID